MADLETKLVGASFNIGGRLYRIVKCAEGVKWDDPANGLELASIINILCVGIASLAEDVYSRQPEGSRRFKEFSDALGIGLVDAEGNKVVVSDLLSKILDPKP